MQMCFHFDKKRSPPRKVEEESQQMTKRIEAEYSVASQWRDDIKSRETGGCCFACKVSLSRCQCWKHSKWTFDWIAIAWHTMEITGLLLSLSNVTTLQAIKKYRTKNQLNSYLVKWLISENWCAKKSTHTHVHLNRKLLNRKECFREIIPFVNLNLSAEAKMFSVDCISPPPSSYFRPFRNRTFLLRFRFLFCCCCYFIYFILFFVSPFLCNVFNFILGGKIEKSFEIIARYAQLNNPNEFTCFSFGPFST